MAVRVGELATKTATGTFENSGTAGFCVGFTW